MTFYITQDDTNPPLESQLTDGGVPIDLTSANDVEFHMEDEFEQSVVNDNLAGNVNLVDASKGKVEYVWKSSDTSDVGTYFGEWQVEYNNGSFETFPVTSKLRIEVVEEIA